MKPRNQLLNRSNMGFNFINESLFLLMYATNTFDSHTYLALLSGKKPVHILCWCIEWSFYEL
ncbi:hypothetical protein TELCIR_14435 [Teladorsagia circumcincta]|uniref:Uncharacterized protein n=1 Tax=Teladorsagia circumcincta TaxID=45464 RepID=A0A2G9U364_TELCI|nr:hypothetical protein TELCIR_14435 [Teladorsagia circumcincta]